MGVRCPIGNAASALAGAVALGLILAGSAGAQTTPDQGGTGSGEAAKSGESSKAPDGAKSGGDDAVDKFKDVKITLNADQDKLIDAIRSLMKSAKADFLIDDDLKAGTVTVHFKDLPFKDALSTLMKVSTIPVAYEVNDGVYHFKRRMDSPAEEKPADPAAPPRPRFQTGRIPLDQIGAAAAMRKLTGPYDTPPPTLYQHSTLPGFRGSSSSSGLSGGGLFQSNGFRYNPDGSVSRTGTPPLNLFGLLRGLLGGLR